MKKEISEGSKQTNKQTRHKTFKQVKDRGKDRETEREGWGEAKNNLMAELSRTWSVSIYEEK